MARMYLLMGVHDPTNPAQERVAWAEIDRENIQYLLDRLALTDVLRNEHGIHLFEGTMEQDADRSPRVEFRGLSKDAGSVLQFMHALQPQARVVLSLTTLVLDEDMFPQKALSVSLGAPAGPPPSGAWTFSTRTQPSTEGVDAKSSITFYRHHEGTTSVLTREGLHIILESLQKEHEGCTIS